MFAPFPLHFSLNYEVSIEIQGLSSTDYKFQGISRIFKVRANPVLYRVAFCVSMKSYPLYCSHGLIMRGQKSTKTNI